MPKRKKKVTEMTTEELARHVFPKKVVDEVKRIVHESDAKGEVQTQKRESKPSSKVD